MQSSLLFIFSPAHHGKAQESKEDKEGEEGLDEEEDGDEEEDKEEEIVISFLVCETLREPGRFRCKRENMSW